MAGAAAATAVIFSAVGTPDGVKAFFNDTTAGFSASPKVCEPPTPPSSPTTLPPPMAPPPVTPDPACASSRKRVRSESYFTEGPMAGVTAADLHIPLLPPGNVRALEEARPAKIRASSTAYSDILGEPSDVWLDQMERLQDMPF